MFHHRRSHHRQSHHQKKVSRVKVIHNVAKGPSVDVVVDGKVALANVGYKAQSDYLEVPSGKHTLSIKAGGKALATADVDLSPNTDYTVIAHGDVNDLSSIALLALQDNNACPAAGNAHIRFVHAAATAPAVDVWAGPNPFFTNVSYGSTGQPAYKPAPAGSVVLSVTPAGTRDVVLQLPNVNLEAGKVYTITASGLVGDKEAPLTALLHEDKYCVTHKSSHQSHASNSSNGSNASMMGLWLNL